MEKPKHRVRGTKEPKPIAHPIPTPAMAAFRERKVEKGINIGRSIDDALTFALANREQWW